METSEEKTPLAPDTDGLTINMVIPVLKISKLQMRNIFENILDLPYPEDDEIIPEKALRLLFFADLLVRVKYVAAEQQQILLNKVNRSEWPDKFVVADGKYCTWTGQTGFLNLETGEKINELPEPPLETIGYNLVELHRRGLLQAEEWKDAKKHNSGSVDES